MREESSGREAMGPGVWGGGAERLGFDLRVNGIRARFLSPGAALGVAHLMSHRCLNKIKK
jgi:hypothetical protein